MFESYNMASLLIIRLFPSPRVCYFGLIFVFNCHIYVPEISLRYKLKVLLVFLLSHIILWACGMNDFLNSPLYAVVLKALVLKYLNPREERKEDWRGLGREKSLKALSL